MENSSVPIVLFSSRLILTTVCHLSRVNQLFQGWIVFRYSEYIPFKHKSFRRELHELNVYYVNWTFRLNLAHNKEIIHSSFTLPIHFRRGRGRRQRRASEYSSSSHSFHWVIVQIIHNLMAKSCQASVNFTQFGVFLLQLRRGQCVECFFQQRVLSIAFYCYNSDCICLLPCIQTQKFWRGGRPKTVHELSALLSARVH